MNRIKELRVKNGLKQSDLAEVVNVRQTTVSNWENEVTEVDRQSLFVLSDFFKVSTDYLLGKSDYPTRSEDFFNAIEGQHDDFRMKLGDAFLRKMHVPHDGMKLFLEIIKNFDDSDFFELLKSARHIKYDKDYPLPFDDALDMYEAPFGDIDSPDEMQVGLVQGEWQTGKNNMVKMKVFNESAAAGLGNYLSDSNHNYEYMEFPVAEVPARANFGVLISGDSMEPLIKNGEIVWVEPAPEVNNGDIGIFSLNGESYCKKLHIEYNGSGRVVSLLSLNEDYKPIRIHESDDLRTFGKVLV